MNKNEWMFVIGFLSLSMLIVFIAVYYVSKQALESHQLESPDRQNLKEQEKTSLLGIGISAGILILVIVLYTWLKVKANHTLDVGLTPTLKAQTIG